MRSRKEQREFDSMRQASTLKKRRPRYISAQIISTLIWWTGWSWNWQIIFRFASIDGRACFILLCIRQLLCRDDERFNVKVDSVPYNNVVFSVICESLHFTHTGKASAWPHHFTANHIFDMNSANRRTCLVNVDVVLYVYL